MGNNDTIVLLERVSQGKPVLITFHKEDIVTKDTREMKFCEAVVEAAFQNRAVTLTKDTLSCSNAKLVFGFIPTKKDSYNQCIEKLISKNRFKDYDTAAEAFSSEIPLSGDYKAVSITPLLPEGTPTFDIAILFVNAKNAMKLTQAFQYTTGRPLFFNISGIRSLCSNITAKSLLTNQITLSFGCNDFRETTSVADELMIVGIPYELISELLHNLEQIMNGGEQNN